MSRSVHLDRLTWASWSPSPQTTYFVNGINTPAAGSAEGAADLANLTGTNVVPIYNATQGGIIDAAQTGMDRLGVGSNKAADTLANLISTDLANDRNINVVGIAGAGKNFPPGPQYTFYVNRQDPVPNLLGVHPVNPVTDPLLFAIGTSPVLSLLNGGGAGYSAPGATVHLIDDPAQGGISPHYLDTYLPHIQPSTSAP